MDEIKEKVTRDDINKKIEEIAGLTKARLDSRKTEITVLAVGALLFLATGYLLGKKRQVINSTQQEE